VLAAGFGIRRATAYRYRGPRRGRPLPAGVGRAGDRGRDQASRPRDRPICRLFRHGAETRRCERLFRPGSHATSPARRPPARPRAGPGPVRTRPSRSGPTDRRPPPALAPASRATGRGRGMLHYVVIPWGRSTMGPGRCSSARTAPGRTARSSGSTGPCRPNGPTGRCSPATPGAPPRLPPGSSTTTLDAATAHWAGSHRSAACHERPGRVHLTGLCPSPTSHAVVGLGGWVPVER
jgi:hypothetical protein